MLGFISVWLQNSVGSSPSPSHTQKLSSAHTPHGSCDICENADGPVLTSYRDPANKRDDDRPISRQPQKIPRYVLLRLPRKKKKKRTAEADSNLNDRNGSPQDQQARTVCPRRRRRSRVHYPPPQAYLRCVVQEEGSPRHQGNQVLRQDRHGSLSEINCDFIHSIGSASTFSIISRRIWGILFRVDIGALVVFWMSWDS
jgi:hypothetical protein